MSISGLQHGISCPELTSLIRPTPPSPEGFWGSHGGIHEGKHNFIIFNHVFSTNLKSSWWAKYRKTKGGQWAGWPASSTSWVWVQLCHPSLIRRVMSPLLALLLGFPKWCVGGYWGVVLDLISPFFFSFWPWSQDRWHSHVRHILRGMHRLWEAFQNVVGERRHSTFWNHYWY